LIVEPKEGYYSLIILVEDQQILTQNFKQLTSDEFYAKLKEGPVYILFWCGMSDIEERALRYYLEDGKIKCWVNDGGDDSTFELDLTRSRTAYEGIALNRWELTGDEFTHFSKLKPLLPKRHAE
jgi:hypothetical protein